MKRYEMTTEIVLRARDEVLKKKNRGRRLAVRFISCAAALLIIAVIALTMRNVLTGTPGQTEETAIISRKGIAVTLQDMPEDFSPQSISGWRVINSSGENIAIEYHVSGQTEAGDDIYEITTDAPVPSGMYVLICTYGGREIKYSLKL